MIVTATNINSSMLEKVTYERDNDSMYGELSVLFKTGNSYYYEQVYVDDFNKLINSPGTTVGKQFKAIIEQKYTYYNKEYKGEY
jgi:hypothetical protein